MQLSPCSSSCSRNCTESSVSSVSVSTRDLCDVLKFPGLQSVSYDFSGSQSSGNRLGKKLCYTQYLFTNRRVTSGMIS